MGATEFIIKSRGRTVSEAFNRAVEDATDEEGNDPYNGTIATCSSGPYDVTVAYKNSKLELQKFIEKQFDKISKRECLCICLKMPKPNLNKMKSKLVNYPVKETRDWITVYEVFSPMGSHGTYIKKNDAIAAARKHTEQSKQRTSIHIAKKLKNPKESTLVSTIEYKSSANECEGEWIFFGLAAC